MIATNTDTQTQDADEKELVKIAEKMTTLLPKQTNVQMNLSVQIMEKDTWQEVTSRETKCSSNLGRRRCVSKIKPSVIPYTF